MNKHFIPVKILQKNMKISWCKVKSLCVRFMSLAHGGN